MSFERCLLSIQARKMLPLLLLALIIEGCGRRQETTSGSVLYEGKPLPHGYITFFPVEGDDNAVGTAIVDGKFSLHVPSGKKRVLITTPPLVGPGEWKPRLVHSGIVVPAAAIGNNQIFEVPAEGCVLHLLLLAPRSKK